MKRQRHDTKKIYFPLTDEGIDAASEHIRALLEGIADRREILRLRLAAEDVLTLWKKTQESEAVFVVQYYVRLGQRSVRLSAAGPAVNPNTDIEESELDAAGNVILESLGISPKYRYEKGANHVEFRIPGKKLNQLSWVALAAVLAMAFGFFASHFPENIKLLLTEQLSGPTLNVLLGMLAGVAMPMIFLSICTGILGIGNVATLGRIGKKFLLRFLSLTFVVAALTVAATVWMFPLYSGGTSDSGEFQAIFNLVLQMIPTNLVSPFLAGNALQLILLGLCLGVALLVLGDRAEMLSSVVRQADEMISLLMSGINRLIPLFVFLTFFNLFVTSDASKLGGAVQILILTAVLCLVMALIFTTAACMRCSVSMTTLLRKTMPIFLVAFSTSSSAASFPLRLEICENRLGVAGQAARFSVSLAQTLFKPTGCIFYSVSALCVAAAYGVSITPLWLVLCVLVSGILTIATPPVAGGTKMAYSALFLQLGIPAEGLVLVLAAEPILDFLLTAVNSHVQVMQIILTADNLDLLDRETLFAL
ncbi:dicarboxylate/amino acid:cation symporter [Anoxybacterium hadale]|uniref:dicarboxylate/amino acid:cation symporter n=1 Tax=Anoxybacterium hadale TaxID=3408580 RepID=UPI003B001251